MLTTAVLLGYLALLLILAWYIGGDDRSWYFVNNRSTGVWTLTFSHFSSMVGAGGSVAIVAEVYRTGISFGLALPLSFLIGACIMAGVAQRINETGKELQATNIVDFFHERFDRKNAILAAVIQVVLLLLWTATQAVAFGSLVTVLTGLTYTASLGIGAGVTLIYTLLGGLQMDLVSDVLQTVIILVVFIVMTTLAWNTAPSDLLASLPQGHLDPFNYAGITWFVGIVLFSGCIYLANSSHWQRILSAADPQTAQRSYLYAIPVLVLTSVAMLVLGLYSTTIPISNADQALFRLMEHLLPPGAYAVGLAAVIAIIMSSIDSLLIGGSTILHERWLHNWLEPTLGTARGATVAFGTLGFLLAFTIPNIVGLGLALVYLALVLVPSIVALLYTDYVSADASFYGMLLGISALGLGYPVLGKNVFLVSTVLTGLTTFALDPIRDTN